MTPRARKYAGLLSEVRIDHKQALLLHHHLRCALCIARGLPLKDDWSADASNLAKIAEELKLDKRLVLLHTCADLAIQIERALSLTPEN